MTVWVQIVWTEINGLGNVHRNWLLCSKLKIKALDVFKVNNRDARTNRTYYCVSELLPSWYLLVQSHQWTQEKNLINLFKVSTKDTKRRLFRRSSVFMVNLKQISNIILAFSLLTLKSKYRMDSQVIYIRLNTSLKRDFLGTFSLRGNWPLTIRSPEQYQSMFLSKLSNLIKSW